MLIPRVKTAYLFPEGQLAVFDIAGHQIAELQGMYSIEKHKRILLEALPDCAFKGFHQLPQGFTQSVKGWADLFRKKNLSWEEIENL